MRTGVVLGILGALAGVTASAYAFVIYMVNGLNGTGNPYASRVGYCIAAFILAIIAGAGAALLPHQTLLGSILLVAGSILGFISINLMYVNTWYALAVPLCILAAIFTLGSLPVAAVAPMQWALLAILAVAAVASYFLAGWVPPSSSPPCSFWPPLSSSSTLPGSLDNWLGNTRLCLPVSHDILQERIVN